MQLQHGRMRSGLSFPCRCLSRSLGGRRSLVISASAFDPKRVRAISLDVTGTIMVHAEPIMKTYADAASWAGVPNPPTEAQLKPAFKAAYKDMHFKFPCFG